LLDRADGEELVIGRLQRRALARVAQPRGLPRQQPCGLDLPGNVGHEEVDALVDRYRLAELAAPLRVLDGMLEGRARDSDRTRRGARPCQVQRPHRDPESLALRAQ